MQSWKNKFKTTFCLKLPEDEREETIDSDEEDTEENIHAAFGEDDDVPEKFESKGIGILNNYRRKNCKINHIASENFLLLANVWGFGIVQFS